MKSIILLSLRGCVDVTITYFKLMIQLMSNQFGIHFVAGAFFITNIFTIQNISFD